MLENLRKNLKGTFNNQNIDFIFNNCFLNTIDTTLSVDSDGFFVITGDIPAMWLRDSSMQVYPYLYFIKDKEVKELIKGVLQKQFQLIIIDPYANACMKNEKCKSEWEGKIQTDYLPKIVWERKFELDSLCFPLFLCSKYFEFTDDLSIFNEIFFETFDKMIETVEKERHHSKRSSYYFIRPPKENVGKHTNPNEEKGLVWSGFRPSDDACKYNYHIPDNMFLVTVLNKFKRIFSILKDEKRTEICIKLEKELAALINEYGITEVPNFGKLYVSETDCLGNIVLDDDANFPSLLSIPFLEYPYIDKEIYANTRRYILSENNKYYYQGKLLNGIGSPHTPPNRVWPLSLSMQGITSNNEEEIINCFKQLVISSNNQNLMHESVDVNNVSIYSRPWFAWANSQFALFALKHKDLINKKM